MMQTSNKLYKFKEELPLTSGQNLDGFELMVECYGNLNQEKNNAILLNHAFSGSHHAAGEHNSTLGWWDDFVGPNKTLDTNKFFIVSANNIGSCFGSSGPISLDKKSLSDRRSVYLTVSDYTLSHNNFTTLRPKHGPFADSAAEV